MSKNTWTERTPAYIDMLLDRRTGTKAVNMAVKEIMRMARALDAMNGQARDWDLEGFREYIGNFED